MTSTTYTHTAEVRKYSRQLSRMVYLILYLVIGVKQIFTPGFGMPAPTTDCQVILAYGLIALALIRLSAYLACLRTLRYEVNPPKI
jgi:hypothetical protein